MAGCPWAKEAELAGAEMSGKQLRRRGEAQRQPGPRDPTRKAGCGGQPVPGRACHLPGRGEAGGHSQVGGVLLADVLLQDAGVDVGRLQGSAEVMACAEGGADVSREGWGQRPETPGPLGPALQLTPGGVSSPSVYTSVGQSPSSSPPDTPPRSIDHPSPQGHLESTRREGGHSADQDRPLLPALHPFPASHRRRPSSPL